MISSGVKQIGIDQFEQRHHAMAVMQLVNQDNCQAKHGSGNSDGPSTAYMHMRLCWVACMQGQTSTLGADPPNSHMAIYQHAQVLWTDCSMGPQSAYSSQASAVCGHTACDRNVGGPTHYPQF